MSKSLKGYKSFKFGAIAVDGGMGTTLAALGTTVKGSVTAETSEATTQDFFIEEIPNGAYESSVTGYPQLSGKLEIYSVDPDDAIKVFGGTSTVTGSGSTKRKVFTPPAIFEPLEVSGEIESKNGGKLAVVRMQLLPVWSLSFQDAELGKIVINWKSLAPTKADTAPYTISIAAPEAEG